MKSNNKVLILTLGTLLSGSAAFAATSYEKSYVESYSSRGNAIPVPVSVVKPELPNRTESTKVVVRFVVDETGTPRNIAVPASIDNRTAYALTEAVSAWRFSPALTEGKPVAKSVILPFNINVE